MLSKKFVPLNENVTEGSISKDENKTIEEQRKYPRKMNQRFPDVLDDGDLMTLAAFLITTLQQP